MWWLILEFSGGGETGLRVGSGSCLCGMGRQSTATRSEQARKGPRLIPVSNCQTLFNLDTKTNEKYYWSSGRVPKLLRWRLFKAMKVEESFDVRVAVTAQHREMLDQVFAYLV